MLSVLVCLGEEGSLGRGDGSGKMEARSWGYRSRWEDGKGKELSLRRTGEAAAYF